MTGSISLLIGIFFLGFAAGNRFTIAMLKSYLHELDRTAQVKKLKELTGYRDERR